MARRANGEGSIYRDAAGRWCVALVLEDGKRKVARLTRLEKESLMPGDIAGTLSPDELQDLLAFLDRQRSSEANAGNEYSRP